MIYQLIIDKENLILTVFLFLVLLFIYWKSNIYETSPFDVHILHLRLSQYLFLKYNFNQIQAVFEKYIYAQDYIGHNLAPLFKTCYSDRIYGPWNGQIVIA